MNGAARLPWWRIRLGFVVGVVMVLLGGWVLVFWLPRAVEHPDRIRLINSTRATITRGEVRVRSMDKENPRAATYSIAQMRPGSNRDVRSKTLGDVECVVAVQWATGRSMRDTVFYWLDDSGDGLTLEIGQDSTWEQRPSGSVELPAVTDSSARAERFRDYEKRTREQAETKKKPGQTAP
jgi:hypothetical protein